MAEGLAGLPDGIETSLYVHIPYCQSICWYCGCNTGAAGKRSRLGSYLDALESEIALLARHAAGRLRVRRLAFGGGSPNAITPVDFVRLCDRITTLFQPAYDEFSVELDPRCFSAEWAKTLAMCGVTRASLGVQSFSEPIQRAIGRIQPVSLIEETLSQLREAGIAQVNFDLMYGLPGQTLDDLEDTIDRAITMQPSRIALFGYAHLPHLIPRQRKIDGTALPGAALRFEMAALGYGRLCEAGYVPVGFDHFSLPSDPLARAAATGRVRRNFQGFSDDACPTQIGLGASAISMLPDRLVQNEKNPGRYRMLLSAPRLPAARGILLDDEDRMRGAIIEALLCSGVAANVPDTYLRTAISWLQPYLERGLAEISGNTVSLPEAALPYARSIAAAFDGRIAGQPQKFSSAI